MKKTIAFLAAVSMVMSLAACGGSAPAANPEAAASPAAAAPAPTHKQKKIRRRRGGPPAGADFLFGIVFIKKIYCMALGCCGMRTVTTLRR